ncbi:related to replication factor C protein [Cephalotrichum gorgonifer]|uniref:Replication factor C subunit 1 n=1 Tax=Cephalotrichum gorgonifer TaxID=2041049 RepID=A0AAE8MZF0_9PEZI|nr:related to replication factor C protein [Cephalotrichum gorgonifer]
MADIRNFFGPKGGSVPARPAPKPAKDEAKGRKSKSRMVIDDSEDDEVVEVKKPVTKKTTKPKNGDLDLKGVEVTASAYFDKPAKPAKPQSTTKSPAKPEVPIRSSPRSKKTAPPPPEKPAAARSAPKRATVAYRDYADDDDDAYMEDADEDADDIFAADIKSRNKRRNDDYMEDESEDEAVPKPKRVASKGSALSNRAEPKPTPIKKRKSPEPESDEEEEIAPRKKPAPARPRAAPKPKKVVDDAEDPNYKNILDNIPTVRPPTPPPADPNAKKFNWRAAKGGAAPAPSGPTAELPEGEDGCLTGLTFVFTGVLRTIDRDTAQALVKRYDGKVTGQPSSKTSYVVLGDDAGPSKLAKIKSHGIKTINEEGLFELIRQLPAHGGGGKGAEKARQKKKEEEDKAKKEAIEMEREEKARKAEAEKAAKAAAASRGLAAPVQPQSTAQLWTTKYAPGQLSHICGNKSKVEQIQGWLKGWQKARKYDFQRRGADGLGGTRAIIISGPPGIGKTTAAHLAAKLEGYDVLESNASDTRSKKLVEQGVGDAMDNTSLLGYFAGDGKKADVQKKKIVIIMDEVDGMSAGDRGGVGALAKFCKKTEVPLILICNERRLPKMKPFDHVAMDIKFQRPTVDQVRSRVMTICHREGLKLSPQVINALIEGCNKDIRQIINMLSTIKLDQTSMDFDQTKSMTKAWEKHVILKPWDICQKMLGGGLFAPASTSTLNDKIELYFNDHDFTPLMIQENYLKCRPALLNGKGYSPREARLKALELVDNAAESISDGDLVDRMIHGPQQHWSLMPAHAVFSTVRPASYVWGQVLDTSFTSWLGNNSKAGRLGRLIREIHAHMRLRVSGDQTEIRQQYLPVLWTEIIQRLATDGKDAVEGVIDLMDSYYLTRDDIDSMIELGVGPQEERQGMIDTQTKQHFTRTYNSMSHSISFMKATTVSAPKKMAKEVPDLEEAIEEEDEGDLLESNDAEDDEGDIKTDKLIKQPKAKGKRAVKKKAGDDEDDDAKPKAKPRAKKAAATKSKAKK